MKPQVMRGLKQSGSTRNTAFLRCSFLISLGRALMIGGAITSGLTGLATLKPLPAYAAQQEGLAILLGSNYLAIKANIRNNASDSNQVRLAQDGKQGFLVSDVHALPNQIIPLDIQIVKGPIEDYKFFMIVGLPEGFNMSAGFPTKNAWLVSMKDIKGLQIIPAPGFVGGVELQIMLFKGKNDVPQTRRISVHIRDVNRQMLNTSPTAAIGSRVAAVDPARDLIKREPDPVPKRRISEEEEGRAMKRAAQMLQNADISAARLIYEKMAMKGSARAAFAMGQTYDPDFLDNFVVEGLKPDVAQARKWYKLAIELGSPEANARLVALNGR